MMKLNSRTRSRQDRRQPSARKPLIFSLLWLLSSNPFVFTAAAQNNSITNNGSSPPFEIETAADSSLPPPSSWPEHRYLCFSNVAVLPPIQVSADGQSIRIGTLGNLQLERTRMSSAQEAKVIAGELGVPTGLVIRVAKAASEEPRISAEDLAAHLRGAAIDLRFLLAELTAYEASMEREPAKTLALLDLLNGDLPNVWSFYRELPWPQAPARLHIVPAH